MSNQMAAESTTKAPTSARVYRNPPVHEVLLDFRFHQNLDDDALRGLREKVSGFDSVEELKTAEMQMSLGPSGQELRAGTLQFAGWLFKTQGPTWVLQTGRDSVTLHAVRPGTWPKGAYVGWATIFAKFLELHKALGPFYQKLDLKRVGLRYINRIALPESGDFRQWMVFDFTTPGGLEDLYTFNLKTTWARAGGHEDISATVGLARIDIDEPAVAPGHKGVLLDIDLFNLWIPNAPDFDALPNWLERAHAVENRIFESCITDALRARFDQP